VDDAALRAELEAMADEQHADGGTQVADVVDGRPVPWPVTDPDRLDERRATVGLEPLVTHLARYA
jgi:hypothetical protein